MGLDWFIQEVGIQPSTNGRRLLTGFLGGLGIFGIYIGTISFVYHMMVKKILR
jgi:uncharacterized membrane protein